MLLQEAFQTLELAEGASRIQIRQAYARLSKIYHVETHPEEFARLHEAYKLALSAVKTENAGEESAEISARFVFPDKEEVSPDSDLFGTKGGSPHPDLSAKKNSGAPSSPSDAAKDTDTDSSSKDAPHGENAPDDILDRILGTNFSIQNCSELTQLICYRCRYDEISPEINAMLLRITNAERGITDSAHLQTSAETVANLPAKRRFLGVPWGTWKTLPWTCIVCHPDFYRVQDTPGFLDELCHFLLEETLNLRDGINQELYFVLCMAYGFFSGKKSAAHAPQAAPFLAEMEKLLRLHPKHKEYINDLEIWTDCQVARRIVLFCQDVYAHLAETDSAVADASRLPDAAAELLLDEEIPWKEFLYDCLTESLTDFKARECPETFVMQRKELSVAFVKKREEFRQLSWLRREFSHDFLNLLDNNIDENYIYNACYLPLAVRLDRIRERYLTRKDWKKIVCRPAFFQDFKNWLFPCRNGFSSVPCLMHYDAWKMLRTCFAGSSSFEEDCIRYLTTEFYFPEYEKRYQRELGWEQEHIEDRYFEDTFPLPALSQGKLDLLDTLKHATPTDMVGIGKIWGNLSFDSAGFDFLIRITNTMTRFNFLQFTGRQEKEAVPGDAFCFLADEVLLYRKKENLICRLTHPIFYDLISWKFEAAAYPVINGKPGYDEDFLDTACKNLYYYRCYVKKHEEQ